MSSLRKFLWILQRDEIMDILIIVGIAVFWLIKAIIDIGTPEQPPIKDTSEHLRKTQQDFWKKH